MRQKNTAITMILGISVLAVIATTIPLAYAQSTTLPPATIYPPNTIEGSETETETELTQKQKGIASGEGQVDNCEVLSLNSPTGGTQCTGDTEVP
jgi:hypothetical protein